METREEEIRQAAIEYASKIKTNVFDFAEGVRWADSHPKSPWISVEDRLPEIDDYVVVIMPTEPPKAPFVKISYLSTIDNDYFFCIDGEMLPVEEFTQWMPIPEPPKGGEK